MGCKCHANKLITNKATISKGAKVITYNGADHLVVPVVAFKEGILNDKYVSIDSIGAALAQWEGVPLPVRHPQLNGVNVSANLPSVIESSVIGYFHNVRVVDKTLQGDLYVNVEDAKRKGFESLLDRLSSGDQVEVSTAYWADDLEVNGLHDGTAYTVEATNIRPDHLAILPDVAGACSVEQGCGTFSKLMANAKRVIKNLLTGNDDSFQATQEAVSKALRSGLTQDQPYPYIMDIYPDSVVYELGGELQRQDYTITDGVVTLGTANPVRVTKQYVPVTANEEKVMAENQNAPAVAAPVVATLDPKDAIAVNWARAQYDAKVAQLVTAITGNANNKFTKEQLSAMPIETLETLSASLAPVDYSARGTAQAPAPVTGNAADVPEALPSTGFAFAKV